MTPESYVELIDRRFANPEIVDTVRRVANDGPSRRTGFVLPVLPRGRVPQPHSHLVALQAWHSPLSRLESNKNDSGNPRIGIFHRWYKPLFCLIFSETLAYSPNRGKKRPGLRFQTGPSPLSRGGNLISLRGQSVSRWGVVVSQIQRDSLIGNLSIPNIQAIGKM